MIQSKDTAFPPADQRLADVAKALSHPARIAILRLLAQRGTCICGEIVDDLPLSQSTVSQHLKALKEAGLIRGTIDGPRSCYCLDVPAFEEAASMLADLTAGITQDAAASCCDDTCC
jgi:ArsR family transcriptional regulator, arsenate/arsenite/antimonite-responsive transcriptional repressor